MNNASDYIEWFWLEFTNIRQLTSHKDGWCQCGSEYAIMHSEHPNIMRTFAMLSVFVDQMMYCHFNFLYQEFRLKFCYPKLYCHSFGNMASPSWFIYSYHGYDKKMDWTTVRPVAKAIFGDLFRWLRDMPKGDMLATEFKWLMKLEIRSEFEMSAAEKLLYIFSEAHFFDEDDK